MANPFTVQDLDSFLASPGKTPAAKQPTPVPNKPFVGPPKQPLPVIKTGADLDKFLAQPIQSYDTKNIKRQPQKTFMESLGEQIPESAVPALAKAKKYLVDPFEKAAQTGTEVGGVVAGEMAHRYLGITPEQHPVLSGVAKGAGEIVGGTALDPRNWPFFASSGVRPILQRIISGGFGAQMTAGTIEAATNLLKNWSGMTPAQRAEEATKTGLSAAMTLGAVSHALSSHIADEIVKTNPNATPEQVQSQTVNRLEELKKMPAAERAQQLQAFGLATDLTDDHIQAALDHINSRRADRMEAPPVPPEKRPFREGPDHYAINVRPMSADERTARAYSLETARTQLDAERAVAAKEQDARDTAERERQRIAKDRQENAQGEADYRAARAGKLVVQDRRPLAFDNKAAEQNYGEYERLGTVLDDVAVEHLYENTEDMVRSLRMERYRGIDLTSKYGDWAENALKTDARRREYLKLSDPRALEPTKADTLRDAATDMRLAEREQNMRAAADKIDSETKSNVTDPEVFEKAKAEADEARKLAEDLRTQRDEAAARRAAQIADRQIYPVGAPIDLTMGTATEVLLPSGRRLKAHYAIAHGDQIVTSHNPLTFDWNDDYGPRQAQPRDYASNKEAQAGVVSGGNAPEPDRIHTDDPSAHNGPPIIRRDGLVLGGNGRTMRLQRAFRLGNGDPVFRHLRSKLEQFGLTEMPEIDKKPSLVRVLDEDVETAEDLFVLGRDLNRTETMGFDEAEAAVTAGRAITDHMLSWGAAQMDALGEDASVRDFMRARGGEIIQQMIDSGMIEPTKRAAYITKSGEMTEAAKDLFENAWLGKIVDDPDLLKTIPADIKRKLTRGVPGLIKAKVAGSMWDISPEVKGALRLWKRIDYVRENLAEIGKKGDSFVDRYLHPQDFENGTELMDYGAGTARELPHPAEEAIAKLLEKPQVEVRDGFSDYGNEAEGKQAQLLGPRPEPVDAFNQFIGKKVGISVEPDQWAVPVAQAPKEIVHAPEEPVQQRPETKVEEPPTAVPAPLGEAPKPSGDMVEKLRGILNAHPGFQGIADEVLHVADILSRNGMGKPLAEMLPEILADVRTEGEPGAGLEQSISDVGNWARRAGKKLTITPYGEQLGLFGGAEPQFILRNRVGDERLVLQSELLKLRQDVPKIAELVDAAGNVKQPDLFGAEEENLFGPGKDEDEDPQGMLFQAPPDFGRYGPLKKDFMGRVPEENLGFDPNPPVDYGAKAREDVERRMGGPLPRGQAERRIAEVAKPERDTRVLHEVKTEHPDWTLSQQLQEAAKRVQGLSQDKKGAVSFLDDGKAVMYLYKTADASTFLHEFFHVMRRNLKPEDIKVLEDWLKIKEGKWGRSNEERAARAFEYYHRERKIETLPEKVQAVFKKIQDTMRKIYEALKGSPLVKPSKEVSALFDRWYGLEKPPELTEGGRVAITAPGPVMDRHPSQAETTTEPLPLMDKPKREGARYRNARIVDEGKGQIVVYDLRGLEAGRFADKVEATKFVDAKTMAAEPLVGVAVDVPQDIGPKKEKIEAAAEMEHPPLTAAEREGAELVANGGRNLLDTGKVRVKVFPEFNEAASWAKTNAKKIRSLQIYKLKDGRHVADFVPTNEKVLFQTDEPSDINREIASLQKRLGSMMPEGQRAMIAQRLFDLEERRRSIPISTPSLEPPPGKVVKLWTSEGEISEVPSEPQRKDVSAAPTPTATLTRSPREVPDEAAKLPEPPRFGGVPERPEPSRVSGSEPAAGRTVRSGRSAEEPRVVGGQPAGSLRGVSPIRIDAPERPAKPPAYSDKDWTEKVKLYELPENAPTPTVGISNNLARMLMGGQRYVVESALSGLDRYDSFILATSTGTGKTYAASAIMHHLLEEKPDAQILVLTPSQGLVGTFKDVAGDFGIEIQDLDAAGPSGQPGVYATTWAASLNREGIETHPWDLVIADEVQEARKWWSSKRGQQMKTMSGNARKVLYMSATPFHTSLEIGHMEKLGLWQKEGFDTWARQFGVSKDDEGNYTGGNAPLKLVKLRQQLIERGQMINVDRNMEGMSAHFGVVPMDGKTTQGLKNIQEAMNLAENYFYAANKRGKVMPTRAQAVTLAKRWLEYQRLPQAIELGKKLQDQGWKVIFFSENKKEFGEVFEFLKEADEGTGGKISQLLPRFRSVTDVLQEHFGDDVGIFAGKHSAARQSELTGFNEGDKKHIYATYGAGGVGVSLHDTVGNAPRAVVYLGPPWSGISFDQALGRPWRYGTRSNVRAYFLFSNAQAEMDIVQNKVAPRMESLRALVSGVHLTDPLVKAMREIPDNREATLDYELGNEHKAGMDQFTNTADTRTVTSYSELPIVHANEAKNKGMKLPGGEGATPPNVVKLFQDGAEDEVVPADQENPALQAARNINVDIAQEFIASGAAPGNAGMRALSPIERRRVADVVMAQAEGAARATPGASTQAVYTAWQNAMTQLDAILSSGDRGMEPPPGGVEVPPSPEDPGNLQTLNWYFATNGRDVIRNAAKAAGVPEIGEKLARDIASYHVHSGNVSGPWVDEYWRILKDNEITKEEHKVLALTMANREEHRPWIDKELMRLRAETPMNDRITRAVDQTEALRKKVFQKMQGADVYLTVYDAATGSPRKVMYSEMNEGQGYWPRKYDYDEVHTVTDPDTGEEIKFTLKQMTKKDGPGTTKREQIIRGMMERHGLSRAGVEDWLGSRKRPVPLVGHVERAREADLPFFRTDPNVMISYLEGAGEVLARKKYFGQDGDKVAGTIAQIPNKKMRDTTKEIIDSLLQRNPMEDESKWMLRVASDWTVLSKMTFSAVKALGHSLHGALLTNTRSYFGGLFEGVFNHKEAQHLADLSGSVMEQTKVEMLSEFGINKKGLAATILKANLWQGAYKWGRVVADANARVFMDRTALPKLIDDPGNALMRRQLKETMLLDDNRIDAAIERRRWTDEDHAWAGKAFSDKVMFTFDPTELPPAWRAHGEGPVSQGVLAATRLATLLRGYMFKTHALLKDGIYDEIKNHGNFRPLLPFLLLYPAMGELIRSLTAVATADKKYFKELLNSKNWTPGQALERYVDDIAHMIGDAAIMSAIKQFHKGNVQLGEKIVGEYAIGSIPSDMIRALSTAGNVAFAKNNRQRRKAVTRLAKDTFPIANMISNLVPAPQGRTGLSPLPPPPAP